MEQKLYVLLGDAVSSRHIDNKEKFQKTLEEMCKKVNSTYNEDLYAQFKILKGIDEIGGVLSTISHSYQIMITFHEYLHPNLMRFALVLDYIDTALETRDVAKMDGPAFHTAAHLMNKLKKSEFIFNMSLGDEMIDTAITDQINLVLMLRKNWSERQRQIIREYQKTRNQYAVAEALGTTQQNISSILDRSMWKEIKSIEKNIIHILNEYEKRLHIGCDIDD